MFNLCTKDYCKKFKFARKKLGITQYELAAKLGVSPSSIGMYEQGRRLPDYDTLIRLCSILRISICDFFSRNEIFNADVVLKYLTEYLDGEKDVILNGKVLDMQKKRNVAYVIKLILNDK